jgi:hypothetical protein
MRTSSSLILTNAPVFRFPLSDNLKHTVINYTFFPGCYVHGAAGHVLDPCFATVSR